MEYTILPVRFDEKQYEELRAIAYANKTRMAVLVRKAVEKMLADNKKGLTDKNIAI